MMKPARARNACMRCRRQKLKVCYPPGHSRGLILTACECDNIRPCQLCSRAGVDCQSVASKRQMRQPNLRPLRRRDISGLSTAGEPAPPCPTATSAIESTPIHEAVPLINPLAEDRGPSSFHLVEQVPPLCLYLMLLVSSDLPWLFRNHLRNLRQSDAIPDGHPASKNPAQDTVKIPVKDLVGVQLPSDPVATILIDAYLEANHWYLALFHVQTFRARAMPMIQMGAAAVSEKPFLLLLLVVLMIGTRFVQPEIITTHDPVFNIESYRNQVLNAVEQHLFSSLHEADLESIGCALLMSIAYLLEGKTKLAFVLSGMGLRIAHAIGLHDERTWDPLENVELQVRRRVWWAIYMADGYAAQAYGKPPIQAGGRFRVLEPQDLDDITTCPGITSYEVREDGSLRPVSSFSYNRYKAQLYSIMSAVMPGMRLKEIKDVYSRLSAWEAMIPPELRLDTHRNYEGEMQDKGPRVFTLQALTLQLAFDHNMLLLLRPFLVSKRHLSIQVFSQSEPNSSESPVTVRDQMITSAIRISSIHQHRGIIRLVSNTTAAAQVCFQCFTAGVILAMLALSDISSPQVPKFKQALARLINILSLAGSGTLLSKQSVEILTDTMHIISSQEVSALIDHVAGDSEAEHPLLGNREAERALGDVQAPEVSSDVAVDDEEIWGELGRPLDLDGFDISSSTSLYQQLALFL